MSIAAAPTMVSAAAAAATPAVVVTARSRMPAANAGVPAAPVAAIPIQGTNAPVVAVAEPAVPAEGPLGHEVRDPADFNPYNEP